MREFSFPGGLIFITSGFLVFMMSSCKKFEGDIVFTIGKGQYACSPRLVQPTGNILEFEFYTHPSWKFDEEYTNGWSKLIGIGHMDHQQNSARIGWRAQGDSIRICGYFYRNGERIIMEMEKLAPGKWYRGSVIFFDSTFTITVNNQTIRLSGFEKRDHYIKNPYFGGTKPAPHTMYFYFRDAYSMKLW